MPSRWQRIVGTGIGLAVLASSIGAEPALAVPTAEQAVGLAGGYLLNQQLADGGFELAGEPGLETPDVILALALSGQREAFWDFYGARSRMQFIGAPNNTPLHAIDALVDPTVDREPDEQAALAARILALVANPLGLSATDFDALGTSSAPVDLLAQIDHVRRADGSYDMGTHFDGVLYAAISLSRVRPPVSPGLLGQIARAQNDDGSWSADGVSRVDGGDVATTSLALLALRTAGRRFPDPTVGEGLRYLARTQRTSGAWQQAGLDDPRATAMASIALSAHHLDLSVAAWTVPFIGRSATSPYRSPYAWLISRQDLSTGRIKSPQDYRGITTLPTSVSIQALGRQWYLAREHENFAVKLSRALGTPDASPGAAASEIVSDKVGANPSIASARLQAANALLSSKVGREAAAADLFRQAFGRTIDASGKTYWGGQLSRITRPEMLSRLTGSDEFYRKAGATIPTFVDASYRAVLGRLPDDAGRGYWIGRLTRGVSVEQVARTLVASTEYRRIQVNAAYQELLGRGPDSAGSQYWTTKLATTRIEVLLAGIASSRELYDNL